MVCARAAEGILLNQKRHNKDNAVDQQKIRFALLLKNKGVIRSCVLPSLPDLKTQEGKRKDLPPFVFLVFAFINVGNPSIFKVCVGLSLN